MKPLVERGLWRLRAASRWPAVADWWATAAASATFLLVALPLAGRAGLIAPSGPLTAGALTALALRVLLLPALVEEVLFRVLPNPHPREEADRRHVWLAAALSLAAYVAVHPLADLLSRGATPFEAPAFLLLAALLGSACLLLYRRSGSLWPPLVLHWLVVTGWLALGGRGILPPA